MPSNWIRVLALAAVVGYLTLPTASVIAASKNDPAAEYRLGPQDKISIKVYEWRPARDEVYEWAAFKAEHTVDSGGFLSLPLVGQVVARGVTTTELAQDIGERLQQRMGLAESPDITVELIQFRPFYVTGAVEKPGEYPFRPGLTVLKAYAIAGGKPRSSMGLVRLEREAITTRGELDAYDLEAQTLQIRLARLRAELGNASEIGWPVELKSRIDTGPLSRVAEQERLVFDTRNEAYRTQRTALEQLLSYLDAEVQSLQKQVEVHKIEADSVKTESELVAGLYKKGLAVASRKLALERGVAQVDGDRLRLESSLMRARQEVSKTKISLIDLQAKRSSDISSEMQKSQGRLEELQSRSETARNLLFETENLAPQLLASQEKAEDLQPRFKIMRGGETLTISGIVEATSIEPGDTLVVEAPARRSVSKSLDPDASTASSAAQALADRLR
jgi:protein involved in polysaccharide export with SLBB domain